MNKKGFTLVELLGVVIILAIVMLIAIPNITGVVERAKKDGYIGDAKKFVYLVKSEVKKGNVNKPASGDTVKVTLKDLSTSDLEKDKDGNIYDLEKSYIYLTRENGQVVYYVQLVADKSKNGTNYRGILLVNANELDDERKYERYYENLSNVSEETPDQVNANKKFEIAIAASNVEASAKSLKIHFGKTVNIDITPKTGYYLSNVTCTNDYTTNAVTGLEATSTQTITISNNSSNYPSTCTFTASKITYVATLEATGVSVDSENVALKYKGTASVEVTPNTGYYLDRITCTNGYTASAKTGINATSKQTVIIENNGVRGSSTCRLIGYPAYPVVSGGSKTWTTTSRAFSITDPVPSELVTRYEYYISNSSDEPSNSIEPTGSFTGSDITIAQSGKYIYFRVIYAHGVTSSWSPAKNLYVDREQIQPPTIIGGGTTLTLEKTFMVISPATTSGVSVYEYYVSDSSIKPDREQAATATLLSPTMTVSAKGTYIYFRVKNNATIMSDWTDAIDLYVDSTTYKIVYNLNGGTQGSGAVSQFNVETEPFNLPGPTRTGYTFGGWYENASFTGTNVTQITVGTQGNKTLYAKWTGITYAVVFDKQNGTGGTDSVSAIYGSPMPSATAPTRTGYTFNGYFSEADGSGYQYYDSSMTSTNNWNLAQNTTLYADWLGHSYTVKFHANGGIGSMDDQQFTYNSQQNLNTTAFTRYAYTFQGWSTNPNATTAEYVNMQPVLNLTDVDDGVVDLYAVWKLNTYTVTFNANDGTTTSTTQTFNHGEAQNLAANSFSRPGYIFMGWGTSSSATTASYTNQQSVTLTDNLTLHAIWKQTLAGYLKSLSSSATILADDGTVDHNMRYIGASPSNYLSFGGQTWRIIGVFSVKSSATGTPELRVKAIRNGFFSSAMPWNSGGTNNWPNATIKTYVNNWLPAAAATYVDNAYWNLGGYNTGAVTASQMYTYERNGTVYSGNATSWVGKVGLMYASDYGFASSSCYSTTNMVSFNASACLNSNWIGTSNGGRWESLLTQHTTIRGSVFYIYQSPRGSLDYDRQQNVQNSDYMRPAVYLRADALLSGGSGTSGSPYTITLQ